MKKTALSAGFVFFGLIAAAACGDEDSGGSASGGTSGSGPSGGASGGKGGTTGKGGATGKGGTAGSTSPGGSGAMAGDPGDAGGDSGGSTGTGGTSGSGGKGGGAGSGTGGTAGASGMCTPTTDIVGTCQLPATSGTGSCIEYYAGTIYTTAAVEQVCAANMGAEFVAGPCPDPSFEGIGRIGCCVTAGSFTRSCYYGEPGTPTSTYESLCQAFGCTFMPG